MKNIEFNISSYSDFISYLGSTVPVYCFNSFTGKNGVILRHDIDLSVEAAHEIAKVESKNGIFSTFLFMTTSPLYNLNSANNRDKIKKIHEMGHEIGLHFDPTVYPNLSSDELSLECKNEAFLVSNIIDSDISTISLHAPSQHGSYPVFPDFINTYDKKYFSKDFYISDSCMDFRGKNIFQMVELAKNNTVQILLHPLHFYTESNTYLDIFSSHVGFFCQEIDQVFGVVPSYQHEIINSGHSALNIALLKKLNNN